MNINISELVGNKLMQLESERKIENAIEETFEKTIVKAVEDALDSYSLKRDIEKKVSDQVSQVVADIDFTSYNGFIVEKMKQIVEDTCRKDLCNKIEKTFTDLFITKEDNIKLSEIFDKYREYVWDTVDESDKYERECFHVKCEVDERYGWINCELSEIQQSSRYYRSDVDISFTVHRNQDNKNTGWISTVYFKGVGIDKKINFAHMNDVELMLIKIAYNKIPIVIDVEDTDDIENYYDVDC